MTVKVPTNGSPLVRELFLAINAEGAMLRKVCDRAGVSEQVARQWKRRSPRLDDFEAMLSVLGLELAILPKAKPFSED